MILYYANTMIRKWIKVEKNVVIKNYIIIPGILTYAFFSLEICISMNSDALGQKDFLFISLRSKIGTASKRFGVLLSKFMEKCELVISSYINPKKGNSHGVRKGSSTHAATRTTYSPSLISIALRRE